jgi:hypothetical protein
MALPDAVGLAWADQTTLNSLGFQELSVGADALILWEMPSNQGFT